MRVSTPSLGMGSVRTQPFLPCGSTSLAILSASELAKSMLAGVTARMRLLSLLMNCRIMSLIWYSMSCGWSPTGTLVIPGRSMRVRFNTGTERGRGYGGNAALPGGGKQGWALTVRGIHAEVDGDGGDALVGPRHPVGFRLDFLPHLVEIREFLGFAVQEFGVFWERGEKPG